MNFEGMYRNEEHKKLSQFCSFQLFIVLPDQFWFDLHLHQGTKISIHLLFILHKGSFDCLVQFDTHIPTNRWKRLDWLGSLQVLIFVGIFENVSPKQLVNRSMVELSSETCTYFWIRVPSSWSSISQILSFSSSKFNLCAFFLMGEFNSTLWKLCLVEICLSVGLWLLPSADISSQVTVVKQSPWMTNLYTLFFFFFFLCGLRSCSIAVLGHLAQLIKTGLTHSNPTVKFMNKCVLSCQE